jgi:hypothetical protein
MTVYNFNFSGGWRLEAGGWRLEIKVYVKR